MPTVDVSFTALPAHVRTARLIALAVARRTGVPEDLLDEVRLAVGEACSRAVGLHTTHSPDTPVSMKLSDDRDCFTVEVTDVGPLEDDPTNEAFGYREEASTAVLTDDDPPDTTPSGFGLVVIGGLVEQVEVTADDTGTHVIMAWPTSVRSTSESD